MTTDMVDQVMIDAQVEGSKEPEARESRDAIAQGLCLDMFEIETFLGEGKASRVHLARHRETRAEYALKISDKLGAFWPPGQEKRLRDEIEAHRSLHHPNIAGLYGTFEDETQVFMLREYFEGRELFELIKEKTRLGEAEAAGYFVQVAHALQHIHSKDIIHRDLKPESILVNENGKIKVAGGTWMKHEPDGRCNELCGTLDYLPPEMLNREKIFYTNKVDIWCLGVLLFEMLAGSPPFEDTPVMTQKKIQLVDMKVPSHISDEAADLINKILIADPEARLSLEEALKHAWVTKHVQEMKSMNP